MTQWGLDTLFNPAKRHMDEEKRRMQSTREEIGDSSGGKRIDLESGKVVIARTDDTDDTAETDGTGEQPTAEPGQGSAATSNGPGAADNGKRPARSAGANTARAARATQPTRSTKPAKSTRASKPARQSGEPTAAEQRAAARRGRQAR